MTVVELLELIRNKGWVQELPPEEGREFIAKDYAETFILDTGISKYRLVILIDKVKPK